ncbi:hypothetical protein [Rhizobium leguminosarum]|uniref:hypothetical protein n=1 Tax=Rhizobium leguminosarum TaxID=384 RepID=UPI001C97CC2C|nr:hypothetical protein [Rhizobium leguminosarum]MBY5827119.1 hypothetical protein [Rhizobium leguminosarum]
MLDGLWIEPNIPKLLSWGVSGMQQQESGLGEISDIEIGKPELLPQIMDSVREAVFQLDSKGRNFSPADPALQRTNDLMVTAMARCGHKPPPPTQIEMVVDTDGSLIYRCQHATPHRWRLDGTAK